MDKGLKLAIEAVGGLNALANALKLNRGTVHHWERVPYSQLLAVERVTRIDRSILRPEMFAGWRPPTDFSPRSNTRRERLPRSTNEEHIRRVRLSKIRKAASEGNASPPG